jgi:hypothetical protein
LAHRPDLFWDYGRTKDMQRPGKPSDRSPNLAIRSGPWKLLVNDDGSNLELYDFRRSDKEEMNVASAEPAVAKELSSKLIAWRKSLRVLRGSGPEAVVSGGL